MKQNEYISETWTESEMVITAVCTSIVKVYFQNNE